MTGRRPPETADVEGRLLGRAAEIGRVLARHGLKELFGRSEHELEPRERARRVRAALEELGPTFAKLGQLLSTRPDLLPPELIEELATLQERVTPMTEAEVVSVLEEELGVPWEDVFEAIEPEPMAAGTIGQVHRARLENGDRVVVKVQRPSAGDDILRDLGLLERFAAKTAGRPVFRRVVDLPAIVTHLSDSLRRELDFRGEAENAERIRAVLASYSHLDAPRVYRELSSARLLVLEEVQGVPVRDAPEGEARREAARQLLESYYRQILGEGFFHADPHPGNMKWWQDRIYFLDFGMVGEVPAETRELLVLLLMALWQEDVAFLTDVVLLLGGADRRADVDVAAMREELGALVSRFRAASLREIELGPALQGLTEIAVRHDVRLPASLALTGKALAQMQLAAAELDPTIDPFAVAGSYVVRSVVGQLRGRVDPRRLIYDAQKTGLRLTRLAEAFERLMGARPGSRLQVEFGGIDRLESAIRGAARRVSLAFAAGTATVAAALTATSSEVGDWLPITLGTVGGAFIAALAVDLLAGLRRR